MGFLWIFVGIIIGIIFGVICGIFIPQIMNAFQEKKMKKDALDIINGKKKNEYNNEGKMVEVNRFVLTNNEGKRMVIDFKDIKNREIKEEDIPEIPSPKSAFEEDKSVKKKKKLRKNNFMRNLHLH